MMKGIKVYQQASHAGDVRRLVLEVDCNDIGPKGIDMAIANAARSGAKELAGKVKRQKGLPARAEGGEADD